MEGNSRSSAARRMTRKDKQQQGQGRYIFVPASPARMPRQSGKGVLRRFMRGLKPSPTLRQRLERRGEVYIPTHSAMRLRHVWGTRSLGMGTGRTTKTEADVMADAKAAPDDPEPLLGWVGFRRRVWRRPAVGVGRRGFRWWC